MSARTYVCFACRWARRAPWIPGGWPRCTHCRKELEQLDRRWRIPGRDDLRGWRDLVAALRADAADQPTSSGLRQDAKLNALDRRLTNALAQPASARLYWRLRLLRRQRRIRLRRGPG